MANSILRTGLTPLWGMQAGTAAKAKACALLLSNANVNTEISEYDQVDAEGRKAGHLTYDCWQTLSLSGSILYDSETDNFERVAELFTVGAAVEDEDALALLESIRVTPLNGCEAQGGGTYLVKSFNISQTNTDAASFDAEIQYLGYGETTPTPSNYSNGPAVGDN